MPSPTSNTKPIKVPCWVCKGSGNYEEEEYLDFGLVKPSIDCEWCNGLGMIEIGSKEHKQYTEAMKSNYANQ